MRLLSIVIPTRGREFYCIEAIKDILSYQRDDFELVICDNSDTDQIEDYLKEHQDERVVYQHIRGRINSVINMDTAMRMATGEYVCMIGDDDTILPAIFEVTEWAKKNDYDNVTPRYMVSYRWPGAVKEEGFIQWATRANDGIYCVLNCEKRLLEFVRNGCLVYSDFLPRVYHGLVKRELLEANLSETGHIIGGLSPDMYLSISVACHCSSFISIHKPFTIAGACPRSTTAESITGGHRGNMSVIPHMYNRGAYTWDNRIPAIYTVQTIWAETALNALEEMKRSDLIKKVNQGFLFAEMVRKNRSLIRQLIPSFLSTEIINNWFSVAFNFLRYFTEKPVRKLLRKKVTVESFYSVNNLEQATDVFCTKSINGNFE